MTNAAIRVENLGKLYHIGAGAHHDTLRDAVASTFRRSRQPYHPSNDTIWALKSISFDVAHGEVLGIIGPNGAGKSTLLKILSRITEPTTGRARINGRVGSLLEVGTGFHPELTGRENIYLSGAILGMTRAAIDRTFDEIVAFSGVEKFLDTPVKRYSSGMRVRLGFAVAAHLDPEILLIDEVLAVGDAQFQKKCLGKMGAVSQEGRTVLFVSHNMTAVQSLCQRAVWLDDGHLIQDGHSDRVVASYLNLHATKRHEQVWADPAVAPGNGLVRLQRVWVESEDRSQGPDLIPREAPLSIGVEYQQLDASVQLHVTLQICVEQQTIAFASASSQDRHWADWAQRTGPIRCVCTIPANLLNTGQHRVRLLVVRDRSSTCLVLDDALAFDVVETDERTGAWFGKVAGAVRPALSWHIEPLDQSGAHLSS